MRYRNRHTGAVVGPSSEVAAQSFARSADWEEIKPFSHPLAPEPEPKPASKKSKRARSPADPVKGGDPNGAAGGNE